MAVVAQLVEPRVVISVVVGSSPISRPILFNTIFYLSYLYILIALVGIFFRLHFLLLYFFNSLTIFFWLDDRVSPLTFRSCRVGFLNHQRIY